MSLVETIWYCNAGDQATTGHYAVAKRPQNAAVVAGQLVRQFTAPAVNSERVFVCIVAGTTANVADATWVLTHGAKTVDGTATWMEVTGQASLNGDLTNTTTWAAVKATGSAVLGQVIKRSNNASYQICTTAGAMSASEPAFSDTAGTTTTDTTAVWTSLGPVTNFTGGQAPFARLASAGSVGFGSGQTVYVGDNHAEAQATAITMTYTNLSGDVGKIICHNHSGSYPPTASDLATTATVSTTGAANVGFNFGGGMYVYGISFIAGVGQSGTASITQVAANYSFERCLFKLASTGVSSLITVNATLNSVTVWNNCQVSFAAVQQNIDPGVGQFTWQNTGTVLAAGSVVPTAFGLIGNSTTNRFSVIILEALDLSQITNLFGVAAANSGGNWIVKDCKLNAALTIATPGLNGFLFQTVRSSA